MQTNHLITIVLASIVIILILVFLYITLSNANTSETSLPTPTLLDLFAEPWLAQYPKLNNILIAPQETPAVVVPTNDPEQPVVIVPAAVKYIGSDKYTKIEGNAASPLPYHDVRFKRDPSLRTFSEFKLVNNSSGSVALVAYGYPDETDVVKSYKVTNWIPRGKSALYSDVSKSGKEVQISYVGQALSLLYLGKDGKGQLTPIKIEPAFIAPYKRTQIIVYDAPEIDDEPSVVLHPAIELKEGGF